MAYCECCHRGAPERIPNQRGKAPWLRDPRHIQRVSRQEEHLSQGGQGGGLGLQPCLFAAPGLSYGTWGLPSWLWHAGFFICGMWYLFL